MANKKTNTEKQNENENRTVESAPQYITKKPDFYCPLAPSMMWHHGMFYKECPLNSYNRDMPQCNGCKLRWVGVENKKDRDSIKKNSPLVEKAKREEIPTIGKTYSTEDVK
jgi:hypothetical protein